MIIWSLGNESDYGANHDAAAGWLRRYDPTRPIQYEGELHDRATYRYFWELLQKAKVTGVSLPDEASEAFFQA